MLLLPDHQGLGRILATVCVRRLGSALGHIPGMTGPFLGLSIWVPPNARLCPGPRTASGSSPLWVLGLPTSPQSLRPSRGQVPAVSRGDHSAVVPPTGTWKQSPPHQPCAESTAAQAPTKVPAWEEQSGCPLLWAAYHGRIHYGTISGDSLSAWGHPPPWGEGLAPLPALRWLPCRAWDACHTVRQ